ncbi:MAG: hypothetical protein DMG14_00490 [Acidobacteria bacterium]|nr:MAG: hypothetical protein DMG14_00490 [Acidobacteriota bacterium]
MARERRPSRGVGGSLKTFLALPHRFRRRVWIRILTAEQVKVTSLRQRLELHRKVEPCASCHKIMDPIGFALENFDMVGTWRELDGKTPIDSSGQLVDGTKLQSAADLRNALLSRPEMFVSTATQKLLTYAIGRTVQYYDMPAVRTIVRRSAANDYRFSSLVLGVVQSDAFQKKKKMKKNSE